MQSNWRGTMAVVVVALISGAAGSQLVEPAHSQNETATVVQGRQTAQDLSTAFRDVIRKVQPAVVAIRTETDASSGGGQMSDEQRRQLEMLQRQFGNRFRLPEMNQPKRRSEGAGSGYVIDAQGVVLTNNHVVEDADRVYVILDDGRELRAERWETDALSDVGVVFLDPKDLDEPLPALRLGDSDRVEIGDWVLAIGNPFNVGTTSTQGIISARSRRAGLNERENYLQTDAAINPGNSGGPLVNLQGEVIGMNTAISSRSGGYDGIGFAIPSNMVRWVSDSLIETGTVERAYLGVAIDEIDQDVRRTLGVQRGVGTVVTKVSKGSPAAKAGIEEGDVIVKLGDEPINTPNELAVLVEKIKVGSSVPIELVRDDERQTVDVTFEKRPGDFDGTGESSSGSDGFDELGLKIETLTAELAEQFEYDKSQTGVVVTAVEPGSAAADKGMQPGDVITRVGRISVQDADDYRDAVGRRDATQGVLIRGKRGGNALLEVLTADD